MMGIKAYKCKKCGLVMNPKHFRCIKCKGREFEEIKPEGDAKLLTYTVVDQLPWGMDERGRILGIVEFDNGVKATGLILADDPSPGIKLRAEWGPVRIVGGEKAYGLILVPAR
jgi:uncharacterized OB-fold protein